MAGIAFTLQQGNSKINCISIIFSIRSNESLKVSASPVNFNSFLRLIGHDLVEATRQCIPSLMFGLSYILHNIHSPYNEQQPHEQLVLGISSLPDSLGVKSMSIHTSYIITNISNSPGLGYILLR